jgi:hypothetical protein
MGSKFKRGHPESPPEEAALAKTAGSPVIEQVEQAKRPLLIEQLLDGGIEAKEPLGQRPVGKRGGVDVQLDPVAGRAGRTKERRNGSRP